MDAIVERPAAARDRDAAHASGEASDGAPS
jgi:hypothetical protein